MAIKRKIKKKIIMPEETLELPEENLMVNESPKKGITKRGLLIVLVILLLSAWFWTHKSWLVVAIVNNRPIFSWEFNTVMTNRFGQQTLEGMISEALIQNEAKKAGVSVNQADIDTKVTQLLKSFGADVKLDDLLKFQGMTRSDFDKQIKIQLMVQKILEKDIKITDKEIDDFILTNKSSLTASQPAELREEAKQAILEQQIGAKAQQWFTELKNNAKIVKFL